MRKLAKTSFVRMFSDSFENLSRPMISLPAYQAIIGLVGEATDVINLSQILINAAERAYALRRMDVVELIGMLLIQLPQVDKHIGAGEYYLALAAKRKGRFAQALELLDRVAGLAGPLFIARTLNTMGAVYFEKADMQKAWAFAVDSIKAASIKNCDPVTFVEANRAVAIQKSILGDHNSALTDIDKIATIAKQNLVSYHALLNSYAVELGEVGRIEEATNISRIVLASPYAFAYPEWYETRDEIIIKERRASRSVVSISGEVPPKKTNVREIWHHRFIQVTGITSQQKAKVFQIADGIKLRMGKKQANKQTESEDVGFDVVEFATLLPRERRDQLAYEILDKDTPDDEIQALMSELIRIRKEKRHENKS